MNKVKIDYDKLIERNILNKLEVVFTAMSWDISDIMPKKVGRNTPENKNKQQLNKQPIENKEVTPYYSENEEQKLNKENPCDLEQCKQNKEDKCSSNNPEECPKNNDDSIHEKEELLKSRKVLHCECGMTFENQDEFMVHVEKCKESISFFNNS